MEKETAKRLDALAYVLTTLTNAIRTVGDSKIKTSLIESAKETTKEILGLLGD